MENGTINSSASSVASAEKPAHGKRALDVSHSDPLHVFKSLDKATGEGKRKLAVEDIYQRKTQLEHILLRPDTYIGSVEPHTDNMFVYDEATDSMVQRSITYVPGLYKIFDEIIVNAADNKQRDPRMSCIKVTIDKERNEISVWNNGKGIPVVEHKVEKMYVPELIFGTLLTSSNYDDSERKVTGGRNGFGAKLCNIFSKSFTVTTSSRDYRKKFKQVWTNNMTKTDSPTITSSDDDDFTCVKFRPDLAKFGMTELDDDIVALMSRRAYDVAGTCSGVRVFLNGKRLPVKSFKDYVALYTKTRTRDDGESWPVVYDHPHPRWEVMMTVSDKGFQQMSFVNSIATTKGGRHVDYVTDMIVEKVIENVKKQTKKSGLTIRPFQVKNHLSVFINCLIENPTFDSQTKENMTLTMKSFGSKCNLSDGFYKQMMKSGILESVMEWMKFKAQTQLNKQCHSMKHSKLKGVPKLEDANEAGTKNSQQCTLILTEGDSAKTLAVAGFSVVGRDRFGVFPLRGKLLNVREASHKQIMANPEINHLVKIIGLQYRHKYETANDLKTLRYGKVMIMADQDQDGSHIKGLVINFIHHNWPSLIRHNFIEEFITPIVKATKGNRELSFFSLPEYDEWKAQTDNWNSWKIKYYKGLGTSTSKEAKEYFSDMTRHRISFKYQGDDDDKALELAFSKKKVDERKDWLTKWMEERKRQRVENLPETYLYEKDTHAVSYREFVDKELVLFSNMDNERSIPSMVDGLKPGQRKVMFTCFKRNDKREVKVAQLSGSVAEMSAYHHGEQSLMSTIVNLAHNFVGSNNINLLLPIGQFGTRLQGGKDAASARYIFTKLNPVAKALFHASDEPCLRFMFDDNQPIEPEWYCPVVPTVLINGAEGIGTAWATKVPNFNPRELVENIRRLMTDKPVLPMKPWYKNFRGTIQDLGSSRYVCFGRAALLDDNRLEITELPIGVWTQQYKESVLEPMLLGSESKQPMIQDYKEYHTDVTVRFVIQMSDEKLRQARREGIYKVFKLQNQILTTQMVLFDADGCLRRFNSAEDILTSFYSVRLVMYGKRKAYLEGMLAAQADRLSNQARFIMEKIEGIIKIENVKKLKIMEQLVERGYDPDPVKAWKDAQMKKRGDEQPMADDEASPEEEAETSEEAGKAAQIRQYDYLLSMAIVRLSEEEKDKLLKERDEKCKELEVLRKKTPKDLWTEDLDNFLIELDKYEQNEREEEEAIIHGGATTSGGGKKGGKSTSKRPAKRQVMHSQVRPSEDATPIEPTVSDEMKMKIEKVVQAKQRQLMLKEAQERGDNEMVEKLMPKRRKKVAGDKGILGAKVQPVEKIKPKAASSNDENDESSSDSAEEVKVAVQRPQRQRKITNFAEVQNLFSDEDADDAWEDESEDGDLKAAKKSKRKLIINTSDDDDASSGSNFSQEMKTTPKKSSPKKPAAKRSTKDTETVVSKPKSSAQSPKQEKTKKQKDAVGSKRKIDDAKPKSSKKKAVDDSAEATATTTAAAGKQKPVKAGNVKPKAKKLNVWSDSEDDDSFVRKPRKVLDSDFSD